MKLFALLALLALASCTSVPGSQSPGAGSAQAAAPEREIKLYLGQRSLNSDWEPVEDQGAVQLEYSQESPEDAVGWEVGFGGSSKDETVAGLGDLTATTGELYGGVRKTFGSGNVRPYVGGGLSFINAEAQLDSASEDDSSLAMYLHGGVQFFLGQSFALGVDLRTLFGSGITLAGFETDADYVQAALTLGWRF